MELDSTASATSDINLDTGFMLMPGGNEMCRVFWVIRLIAKRHASARCNSGCMFWGDGVPVFKCFVSLICVRWHSGYR